LSKKSEKGRGVVKECNIKYKAETTNDLGTCIFLKEIKKIPIPHWGSPLKGEPLFYWYELS
jgi:hypothetical protein